MRHNKCSAYEQAYNAQASVDADGSYLVLSTHVSQCASDRNELVPAIEAIPKHIGQPVFGTIKKWMGFTQFPLRGHENVSGEWQLVTLSYNM